MVGCHLHETERKFWKQQTTFNCGTCGVNIVNAKMVRINMVQTKWKMDKNHMRKRDKNHMCKCFSSTFIFFKNGVGVHVYISTLRWRFRGIFLICTCGRCETHTHTHTCFEPIYLPHTVNHFWLENVKHTHTHTHTLFEPIYLPHTVNHFWLEKGFTCENSFGMCIKIR